MRNICDYMIIQRDADGFGRAVFSGSFKPENGEVIIARVMREDDNMTVIPWHECETNGNEWKTQLIIPQGGLYRVEARQTKTKESLCNNRYDWETLIECVYHVGVGDVFVMAGQSNMSGYAKDPAYDPPQLGVHLFDNRGKWVIATQPLNSVVDPVYCNNDANSGVSPGLSFGRMMQRQLGVPIGLVSAAQGGSSLEAWNPAEDDCYLYKALEEKMEEVGKFTGMIWYQGCNEAREPEEAVTYYDKFEQSVSLWRKKFGDIPIAVCQLNRHANKQDGEDKYWGVLREAQRQAGINIPKVYVVPTIDMHTCDGIHNSSGACVTIGERLASVMLKGHYNLTGSFAPNIKSIKRIDNRKILLQFYGTHMLKTMDNLACGMNIEDENGMMKCTEVAVCDDGAIVTGERDIGKDAVFHAYWEREQAAFFLRDIYGMPMLACYGVKIED